MSARQPCQCSDWPWQRPVPDAPVDVPARLKNAPKRPTAQLAGLWLAIENSLNLRAPFTERRASGLVTRRPAELVSFRPPWQLVESPEDDGLRVWVGERESQAHVGLLRWHAPFLRIAPCRSHKQRHQPCSFRNRPRVHRLVLAARLSLIRHHKTLEDLETINGHEVSDLHSAGLQSTTKLDLALFDLHVRARYKLPRSVTESGRRQPTAHGRLLRFNFETKTPRSGLSYPRTRHATKRGNGASFKVPS